MKLFNCKDKIILENDRVRLQPLLKTDILSLLPIATQDKTLMDYSPSATHSQPLLQQYIDTALEFKSKEIRYPFLIFDKKTNQIAGSTSFGNISNQNQRIEIGWTWIGKDFQGTGLNKACKFLLMSYAFETLEFERVELKTDARNAQSRRAIEKIGGKYEGMLRSHTLMSDGYRRDTVYYGILKNEWETVKNEIFGEFI